jgi:hypothetical protein
MEICQRLPYDFDLIVIDQILLNFLTNSIYQDMTVNSTALLSEAIFFLFFKN